MHKIATHLFTANIATVCWKRDNSIARPHTISIINTKRSTGLPDRSGSTVEAVWEARLSQLEILRVLMINSHTYGIHIQSDGLIDAAGWILAICVFPEDIGTGLS